MSFYYSNFNHDYSTERIFFELNVITKVPKSPHVDYKLLVVNLYKNKMFPSGHSPQLEQ